MLHSSDTLEFHIKDAYTTQLREAEMYRLAQSAKNTRRQWDFGRFFNRFSMRPNSSSIQSKHIAPASR